MAKPLWNTTFMHIGYPVLLIITNSSSLKLALSVATSCRFQTTGREAPRERTFTERQSVSTASGAIAATRSGRSASLQASRLRWTFPLVAISIIVAGLLCASRGGAVGSSDVGGFCYGQGTRAGRVLRKAIIARTSCSAIPL